MSISRTTNIQALQGSFWVINNITSRTSVIRRIGEQLKVKIWITLETRRRNQKPTFIAIWTNRKMRQTHIEELRRDQNHRNVSKTTLKVCLQWSVKNAAFKNTYKLFIQEPVGFVQITCTMLQVFCACFSAVFAAPMYIYNSLLLVNVHFSGSFHGVQCYPDCWKSQSVF